MDAQRQAAGARRSAALLAATVGCLAVTIVAGYVTRLRLVEEDTWVTHTQEVELTIADAEISVERGDRGMLLASEATIQSLTVDNPVQRDNVARARALSQAPDLPRDGLLRLFESMRHEEERLMVVRRQAADSSRARSAIAFLVGAVLTMAFGILAYWAQVAQHRSLTAAHRAVARQQALLGAIIETVDEGIIAVDASYKTIAINAVARAMVGAAFPRDRMPEDWSPVLGAFYEDGTAMAPRDGPLARALRGEAVDDIVYRIVPAGVESPGGTWVSTTGRAIRDADQRVVAAVATLRDITEQRVTTQGLRDLSLTDELTGLLNRRGFLVSAAERVTTARRTLAPVALLYADINGLKRINDGLGHEQGDRAIEDAARVLRQVFRDGDVVARLGGDEFVALLPNLAPASGDALLRRLAEAVRLHAERQTRPYRLSMSTGLTFMDEAGTRSLEELLAEADRRMYERKRGRAGDSLPVIPV